MRTSIGASETILEGVQAEDVICSARFCRYLLLPDLDVPVTAATPSRKHADLKLMLSGLQPQFVVKLQGVSLLHRSSRSSAGAWFSSLGSEFGRVVGG